MNRKFKGAITLVLTALMILSTAPILGVDNEILSTKASAVVYNVGDIITFGSYPQSKVTDLSLLSQLNAGQLTWASYHYYSGNGDYDSMVQSDYMKYADISYGDSKYRAVRFTAYRPNRSCDKASSTDTSKSVQDDNGYYVNETYWFKYEPLKWRVIDPNNGLVMCESIIDSQTFNSTAYLYNKEWYSNSEHTNLANSYETSSIRSWLNSVFYNVAFTADQKSEIKPSSPEIYGGNLVYDNVVLLTYDDTINADYGFNDQYSVCDSARQARGTDYAKCQGCYVNTLQDYLGCSPWWLVTPGASSSTACSVNNSGDVYNNGNGVSYYDYGVRPVIKLSENLVTGINAGIDGANNINADETDSVSNFIAKNYISLIVIVLIVVVGVTVLIVINNKNNKEKEAKKNSNAKNREK